MIQMTETVADYTTSLDMILQSWHNLRLSSVGVLECQKMENENTGEETKRSAKL
jgi:hypothetical protein